MIWQVPNDVSTDNLDREATLKYFTSGNALSEFDSTLREFYTRHFKMERSPNETGNAEGRPVILQCNHRLFIIRLETDARRKREEH